PLGPPQATVAAVSAGAAAGVGPQRVTVVTDRSGRRSIFPGSESAADIADDATPESMVRGASVLRTKAEAPATVKLPFDASRRVNYSDYSLPPLEFLNEDA